MCVRISQKATGETISWRQFTSDNNLCDNVWYQSRMPIPKTLRGGPMNLLFNQERLVVSTKFTPGHRRNIMIQYTETVQRRRMSGFMAPSLSKDWQPRSRLYPVNTFS